MAESAFPRGSACGEDELARVLAAFVSLLPGEDAAASVLGAPFDTETLVASSRRAAVLDEAQIDLGQGPGWDACRSYRPVEMHVDEEHDFATWPVFTLAAEEAHVRSAVAVPMLVGTSSIGAVTLYSSAGTRLGPQQLQLAARLSARLAQAFVEHATAGGFPQRDPALSRRDVHRATGMVMSQMHSTPADALLVIRAHAFAEEVGVREVAARILARSLDFSLDTAR